jgi:uncharacterized protein YecT (DUF1311 family)
MLAEGVGRSAVMVLTLMMASACNRAPEGGHQPGPQGDTAALLREADSAMHALAGEVDARLSGDDKQRFHDAEEAWLAYRDAHCDAEKALHKGSSDEPSIEASCLARLINERRAELQRVYQTH